MPLSQFVGAAAPGEAAAIARDVEILDPTQRTKTALAKELLLHTNAAPRAVTVNGRRAVVSAHNARGSRYYSQGSTFALDPASLIVSNVEESEPLGPKAKALLKNLEGYAAKHYSDAALDVFETDAGLVAVIVGEKLSPRNFFNGAWTAQYTLEGTLLKGTIAVDVHYFEDGNVRLKATHKVSETASDPVAAISAAENKFQQDLTAELALLNERQFKALRRQLPVTRAQMVWSKASAGYKIGSELEGRR